MTNLLSRGRLEVETDLLLGAEEVLLPAGMIIQAQQPGSETASARTEPARFDASLFAAAPPKPQARDLAEPPSASQPSPKPRAAPAQPPEIARQTESLLPNPLVDRVSAPAASTKAERLALLDRVHARECPHCTTATAHTRLVFGEGNPDAELVFVGEAPGETEDKVGRPFVGRAGEKLDEMIHAMGLKREDVYIANVLKSRPPDNRTPLAHEVDGCGPYLLAQLSVIRPKVIVCLGGPATKLLLATELGITRMRGAFSKVELGRAEGAPFEVPVMPTFHPAYLLRNYTVETRAQVWEDLKKVLTALGRAIPMRAASRSG